MPCPVWFVRHVAVRTVMESFVRGPEGTCVPHAFTPPVVCTLLQSRPVVPPLTQFPPSEMGFSVSGNVVEYVFWLLGPTVRVAELLVTVPAELLTTRLKVEPLSVVVVAGGGWLAAGTPPVLE